MEMEIKILKGKKYFICQVCGMAYDLLRKRCAYCGNETFIETEATGKLRRKGVKNENK